MRATLLTMTMLATLSLGAGGLGAAQAEPVPAINIALELNGKEVAATTTLADGAAVLQAEVEGEYSLILQTPLPQDAWLVALVGDDEEETSVLVGAGAPPLDAPLSFAANAGDRILVSVQGAGEGEAPAAIPSQPLALEETPGFDAPRAHQTLQDGAEGDVLTPGPLDDAVSSARPPR